MIQPIQITTNAPTTIAPLRAAAPFGRLRLRLDRGSEPQRGQTAESDEMRWPQRLQRIRDRCGKNSKPQAGQTFASAGKCFPQRGQRGVSSINSQVYRYAGSQVNRCVRKRLLVDPFNRPLASLLLLTVLGI